MCTNSEIVELEIQSQLRMHSKMPVVYCGVLLQSPLDVVNSETAGLCHPCEHNSNAVHSVSSTFSSGNSSQWDNSQPASNSVCQHHLNAEAAAIYNGRLLEADTAAHQMALRPPSDLDPAAIVRDLYNPELDATENPEYFHINSMLFTAHQLRSQRYGRSFFEN